MDSSLKNQSSLQIDTPNFREEIRYRGNRIVSKYYRRYEGELQREEQYFYDPSGRLEKILSCTKGPYMKVSSMDSTVYQYEPGGERYKVTIYETGDMPLERRFTTVGDTTYIEEFINGQYGFTVKEYFESKQKKVSQIVLPEVSAVRNSVLYDEKGNETAFIRTDGDAPEETTMAFVYEYDGAGRVAQRRTYWGLEHHLSSIEIRLYD